MSIYSAENAETGETFKGDHVDTLAWLHANGVRPAFPRGDLAGTWQDGRVTVTARLGYLLPERTHPRTPQEEQ